MSSGKQVDGALLYRLLACNACRDQCARFLFNPVQYAVSLRTLDIFAGV